MSCARTFVTPALVTGLFALTLATQAEAFTLTYSAFASNAATDVSVFDATLSLSVAAATGPTGNDLLIVGLSNQTAAPDAYTLSAMYLNYTGGADPSTFTLVSDPLGGAVLTAGKTIGHGAHETILQPHAGAFGYYDLLLDLSGGPPHASGGLAPGDSATWEIDLGGTGFADLDFGPLSSTPSSNQVGGAAALKFSNGPHAGAFVLPGFSDDPRIPPNSVAAVIPEPTSGVLIASALLGLAWRARHGRG